MGKRSIRLLLLSIAILITVASTARADVGQIVGTVLDEKSGQPLIGASVQVEGTTIGAACDIDGRYTIRNVPEGTQSVTIASVGYSPKKITGVQVPANSAVTIDASLGEAVTELKAVEVTAERAHATESAMLIKRRASASVTDGISAEMIRKTGDANAGDALRRVPGISVVDGRSLVVRGMSGRYSNVRLNGASLPSLEPERKEVPLDLFPSGLLDAIEASKTFTPDQSGSFCGGSVDLTTRDFPSHWTLNVTASGSSNTVSTGKERLTSSEGQKSFLGFDLGVDDGSRALPTQLESGTWSADSVSRREAGWAIAGRRWTPLESQVPLNSAYGINLGNTWEFDQTRKLGLVASFTYGNTYKIVNNRYREWGLGVPSIDYHVTTGNQNVLWGSMVSSSYSFSPSHKISFKALQDLSADDEARQAIGYDEELGDVKETRLRFLSRSIGSVQLSGDHSVDGLLNSKIEWRTSYSNARRQEPANRSNYYLLNYDYSPGDTTLIWRPSGYSGSNIYTDFTDRDGQFGLDWTIPFAGPSSRIKMGTYIESKTRDYSAVRYRFVNFSGRPPEIGLAEQVFTDQNIGGANNQYHLENATYPDDRYDGNEHNTAAYVMADFPLVRRVRYIGGARFEQDLMAMNTGDRSVTNGKINVRLNTNDWLPMSSVVWSATDRMTVRGSISRTLAHPEYRELSPAGFQDFVLGPLTQGNPNLVTCYINNYDLRWEFYPRPGELLAVSLFWKKFTDPIERIAAPASSSRPIFTYENSDRASDRGLELELRRSLGFVSDWMERVGFAGNLTLLHSRVYTGQSASAVDRPLDGQSPYMLNCALTYASSSGASEFSVLFNSFGDRLVRVAQLVSEDYYEQGRQQVDLNFGTKIWGGVSMKASAKNLLGAHYKITQKQTSGPLEGVDALVEDYKLGVSYGMGVTYAF